MRSRQRLLTTALSDYNLVRCFSAFSVVTIMMLGSLRTAHGLQSVVLNRLYTRSLLKQNSLKTSIRSHSSSSQDPTKSDSITFIGKVVQTYHDGQTKQGIVRNVKRGGWFAIQLLGENENKIQSQNMQTEQPIPLFQGDFIHKRFKDISFTPSSAISTFTNDPTLFPTSLQHEHPPQIIHESNFSSLTPPTMTDLDQLLNSNTTALDSPNNKEDQNFYLQQCSYFVSFRKWVVFSDLHCSVSTLPTCLDVLQTVFHHAQQRNAGVIFLGDFWHLRGTIRIDCLNAILKAFSVWDRQNVPLIMIPGNHDQVTLQGLEHGLTPLKNAFFVKRYPKDSSTVLPGVLIFTHPTIFKRALFIPHIRDIATVQSILLSIHPQFQPISSHVSKSPNIHNSSCLVDSILCHADITGALMNDHIISTGGIAPSYFPPRIPIYSGHFHKPQFVDTAKDISIRYVGSPYQVSLSEAGESKSLLVLDSDQGWSCVEEIPLDLGKKHFKVSTVDEFLNLSLAKSMSVEPLSTAETLVQEDHGKETIHVNPADRVVVTIQPEEMEDMKRTASRLNVDEPWIHVDTSTSHMKSQYNPQSKLQQFEQKISNLRAAGVSVELREVKRLPNYPMVNLASIQDPFRQRNADTSQKDTTPESWLSLEELSPMATLSSFLYHEVERGAMKNQAATILLDAGKSLLEDVEKGSHDSGSQTKSSNRGTTHLCLESVTIQGFGPFKGSATYPLINRGLVLLRGSNKDGGSFDSNGSGKTTLAMSALWILTGSVDSRPLEDSKVADVVNDFSKLARGTLRGTINGSPFIISRSKTSAKGSLTFFMNDKDLTRQSIKETQNVIDEIFGVDFQILSRTIFHGQHTMNGLLEASDTKLKEELSLIAPIEIWQETTSTARSRSRTFSTKAAEIDGMISVKKRDLNILKEKCATAEGLLLLKQNEYDAKQKEIQHRLMTLKLGYVDPADLTIKLVENEKVLNDVSHQIISLETQIQQNIGDKDKELNDFRSELFNRTKKVEDTKADVTVLQRQADRTKFSLDSAREKMNKLKSIVNGESPSVCPTCLQSLEDVQSHIHLEQGLNESIISLENLEKTYEMEINDLTKVQSALNVFMLEVNYLQTRIQQREEIWRHALSDMSQSLSQTRSKQASLNGENSKILRQMNNEIEIQAQETIYQAELDRYNDMLKNAKVRYETLQADLNEMMQTMQGFEKDRDSSMSNAGTMSSLVDALGPRGIQTFILQNAVYSLELLCQTYLDELSGGTLRLHLIFDSSERIARSAEILGPDGQWLPRPMSSLSGGQWRRCSLALSLGFADLVARRGRLRSSLLVLDEPLTHLDSSGRASVGQLLRKILGNTGFGGLATSTILIILQDLAAEELEESFDSIDEVTKIDGSSIVRIDQ